MMDEMTKGNELNAAAHGNAKDVRLKQKDGFIECLENQTQELLKRTQTLETVRF